MNLQREIKKSDEAYVYRLRALYDGYGYTRYKVSKFETYDLYARNKSFLICENILTFTDTNGTLMALKPDVTLSIVKNFGASSAETGKVYYSETVYRTSARSEGFREIRQTGLECIGRVDRYLTGEVLMLASRSLAETGRRYLLDVSHMGFLTALLSECGVEGGDCDEVLALMANKNLPGLSAFCASHGLSTSATEALVGVTSVYAPLPEALRAVERFVSGDGTRAAYDELSALCDVLGAWEALATVHLDFSLACDRNYYNGIVFRGYIDGVPEAVLSGG
ncbi:MAG: ATP phosphoribosyltransferase regulatory subunit, partial [Clostridia bacterium]|nr:ATP phosphoribosyltransferase regulatory subunit [Clostridia bacterium]